MPQPTLTSDLQAGAPKRVEGHRWRCHLKICIMYVCCCCFKECSLSLESFPNSLTGCDGPPWHFKLRSWREMHLDERKRKGQNGRHLVHFCIFFKENIYILKRERGLIGPGGHTLPFFSSCLLNQAGRCGCCWSMNPSLAWSVPSHSSTPSPPPHTRTHTHTTKKKRKQNRKENV